MRILACCMLDFLDIYWQIWLSTNLPLGFICGNHQVKKQYSSINQHCHIVHKMPRYRDVLPIVGSRTFETIVHVYDAKAFRSMLVLQALHHLHCKLEVFYPGTLEMFQMFGKYWIIFSTSCVMIWHILYLELKRCHCFHGAEFNLNVNLCDFKKRIWWWNEDSKADWKIATWNIAKILRSTKTIQRRSKWKWVMIILMQVDARLSNHSIWRQTSIAMYAKQDSTKERGERMVCLNVSDCAVSSKGTTHRKEVSCKLM